MTTRPTNEEKNKPTPFAWVERYEVLAVWLVVAALIFTLSWLGLLQ